MPNTQLSDVFVPTPFSDAVAELSANKAGVVTSGAVATNNTIQSLMDLGGLRMEIPFLIDTVDNTSGTPSSDDAGDAITHVKVSGSSQNAIRISRNFSWASAKLAAQASGNDILGFAASRVSAQDVNSSNIIAMNCIEGVIAGATDDLLEDNTTVSITRDMVISSLYNSLGDGVDSIGVVIMHPSLIASLKSEDLTAWSHMSAADGSLMFETYLGMRVIADQNITAAPLAGDYCAYFLGNGYLQYGKSNVETVLDFDHAAGGGRGIEHLYYRKDEIIHPDGFSFTGSVASDTPTDAELANGANWTQVYTDRRNLKLMKLIASA